MDKLAGMSEPWDMRDTDNPAATSSTGADARTALLRGFAELVLSRRYGDFGVASIIQAAQVARSTFYYHFAGKDDLLLENLRPFVETLAAMPQEQGVSPTLEQWVSHIWTQRATARRLLGGHTGDKLQTLLADTLRERLTLQCADSSADSLTMLAEQIAASSMALLRAWVAHRFSAAPPSVALSLWRGARALSQPCERS